MTTAGVRAARSGRPGAGLALAVLSAATFSTSGTFASSLIQAGWSPAAAVIIRIAMAALILTGPGLMQLRGRWRLLRRATPRVAAYGLIAVAGCQLFYFSALARIPVGVALLLEYLGTVLVVGWLWLRHGERPRRLTVIGTISAMAGLVMVLDLVGSARIDLLGVMWGLLAAVGLAVYFVLSASGGEPLPPIVMAWGGMCVGAATLGALAGMGVLRMRVSAADVSFLGHRVSWIVPVLGLSLVAAVIAYVAGIGAARRLGAKLASVIGMAEVLFAVLFAWLLLGQLPSPVQFLGGAFILAGIVLVRASELRSDPAPATAEAHEDPERPPAGADPRAGRNVGRHAGRHEDADTEPLCQPTGTVQKRRPLLRSRAGRAPEAGTALGETTNGEPAEGVRASDAERDATVERLSQATGSGAERLDRGADRRAEVLNRRSDRHERLADRRAERRPRRGRYGGM